MSAAVQDKPAGTVKNDAYIQGQLAAARRRIRFIDLATALFAFLAGAFVYALVMVLLDRRFTLSAASRQVALLCYTGASLAFLVWFVLRPLLQRVNPYYAARQLEQTLPG